MRALRVLLLLDSAVLLLLGAALILLPHPTGDLFSFTELPPAMTLLLGLWGACLLTLGVGHFLAALEPYRHVILIQVAIARGVVEVLVSLACVARGVVTFGQAASGVVAGLVIVVGYLLWYPRLRPEADLNATTSEPGQPGA